MDSVKRSVNEYRFFALRRSGQHGIIFWIAKHFDGEVLFYNNVPSDDPEDQILLNKGSDIRSAFMFNVEDADLRTVSLDIEHLWAHLKNISASTPKNVLILRDPYNLFASRIYGGYGYPHHCRPLWLEHAREFVGQTTSLPKDTLKVSFNEWAGSEAYREKLRVELGLPAVDVYRHEVRPRYKSSFQVEEADAKNLDLFNRWRVVKDWPMFRAQVDHEEVHDLAHRIFGDKMLDVRRELGM